MSLKLTIVDQTPVHGDRPSRQAPDSSVELARACDELGYHRYWLAEHHNSIQFANPCPEIMIARIASATQHMRIGSGGVMLTHYSPYKVAEVFRMLASLFSERIDLGIGRAPGGTPLASAALAAPYEQLEEDTFPQQAAELCAFLRNEFPARHPYGRLHCLPDNDPAPQLWMLGSGGGSSSLAGHLGMGLSVAKFIAPQACSPAIFANYERHFREAGHDHRPSRMLALAVICAETEEEAQRVASTAAWRKMMTGRGAREPLLSPEEIDQRRRSLSASDLAELDATRDAMVVGTPEQCWEQLHAHARDYQLDELGLVTVTHNFADRLNSYRLLAAGL